MVSDYIFEKLQGRKKTLSRDRETRIYHLFCFQIVCVRKGRIQNKTFLKLTFELLLNDL